MLRRDPQKNLRPPSLAVAMTLAAAVEAGTRRVLAASPHMAQGRGVSAALPDGRWILAHAASGGDVRALASTLVAVRRRTPGLAVVLSVVTATGHDEGQRLLNAGVADAVIPAPIGQPSVARALVAAGPRALILERLELWPCLLDPASATSVPIVLTNGHLGARSARAYRATPTWTRWLLRSLDTACMLTDEGAARLERIVPWAVDAIGVTTTSKIASEPPAAHAIETLRRRYGLGPGRDVLVAGSVRLEEVDSLLTGLAGRRLMLVPRYPDDASAALSRCRTAGLSAALATRLELTGATRAQIVVVDRFGELPAHYGLAAWSFVGGTVADVGGHNPLEALAAGSAVTVGPNTHKIEPLLRAFEDIDGAVHRFRGRDVWPDRTAASPRELVGRYRTLQQAARSPCAEAVVRLVS